MEKRLKMKIEYDLSFEFEYKGMTAQIRKIQEEFEELKEAVLDRKYLRIINNDKIAEEAFDVIESCFTLLKSEYWFEDMLSCYIKHRDKLLSRKIKENTED